MFTKIRRLGVFIREFVFTGRVQKNGRKILLVAAAIALTGVISAPVQANTSARIEGVAQFLIERAQENYLYIFEQKIRANGALQCYFGKTMRNLEFAGLKELLLSRKLWQNSLEKDLDALMTRAAARSIQKSLDVSSYAVSLWGEFIEFHGKIQIEYQQDDWRDLNFLPLDADQDLKDQVNSFYEQSNAINDALLFFKKFDVDDLCKTPTIGHKDFIAKIDAVYHLDDSLKAIERNFRVNKDKIRFKDNPGADFETAIAGFLVGLADKFQDQTEDYRNEIDTLLGLTALYRDDDATLTVKAIETLIEVKKSSGLKEEEFEKLKRHVLFFAQIGSADAADEVAAILKAYTVPAVSFIEKRKSEGHWLINSYLGLALGDSDLPSGMDEDNNFGIYAPIGIEYTHGLKSGRSVSYLVAPLDFGYPVSLKLNGLEDDYETDEIIAPSFGVTWGLDELPLAIGVIYQVGKSFDGEEEERLFLHFSFDMPLLNL